MATSALYAGFFSALANAEIDLLDHAIKVSLHTSAYTPALDTDDFFNDVTNELANGNGYTTGGATLANDTLTYTAATNTWKYDADDVSWTSASFTARHAVIRDANAGTAATQPLIAYQNMTGDQTVSSATFTIAWHANGIFDFVVSAEA